MLHQLQAVHNDVRQSALKRSSPNYEPCSDMQDLKTENQRLRTFIRNIETQLIRSNAERDDYRQRLAVAQHIPNNSKIDVFINSKALQEDIERLHEQLRELNGANNALKAQLREAKSEQQKLMKKVKRLQILEEMREERFSDEVARVSPIVIESHSNDNSQDELIAHKRALGEGLMEVMQGVFQSSAKLFQRNKKTNCFSAFKISLSLLKEVAHQGYSQLLRCFNNLQHSMHRDIENQVRESGDYRDTLNEWVIHTLVEISSEQGSDERRLYRLMGLYYRTKFPLGQKQYKMQEDVKEYFADCVSRQLMILL